MGTLNSALSFFYIFALKTNYYMEKIKNERMIIMLTAKSVIWSLILVYGLMVVIETWRMLFKIEWRFFKSTNEKELMKKVKELEKELKKVKEAKAQEA